MYKVEVLSYEDLSTEEQKDWKYLNQYYRISFLKITYKGKKILLECDHSEPEDATFIRDLKWVKDELERAYRFGYQDAQEELQNDQRLNRLSPRKHEEVCSNCGGIVSILYGRKWLCKCGQVNQRKRLKKSSGQPQGGSNDC